MDMDRFEDFTIDEEIFPESGFLPLSRSERQKVRARGSDDLPCCPCTAGCMDI